MTDIEQVRFGSSVRELRTAHAWSLRDLAERITFHRGYVGKVEQGEKFPDRKFAELADAALDAHGILLTAWDSEYSRRREAERMGRLLTSSVADSLRLIKSEVGGSDIEALHDGAQRIAVQYLTASPGSMLMAAVELRSEVLRRLDQYDYRPSDLSDLNMTMGTLQGVLAYAAVDLGQSGAAMTHAQGAWVMAERIDSNELRAWVRGTESLIARFDQRYEDAEALALDGLRYDVRGTGRLRLLAGVAQCRACRGDSAGANDMLNQARRERDELTTKDSIPGLFTFSRAKQHYYAGSSLMWLDNRTDLERAAREATTAVAMWEAEPPATRSLDDEALARVYAATAQVQLGDLADARQSIAPVLALPADRRISWIVKRLRRVAGKLNDLYPSSAEAAGLRDEIREVSR